jgi:hypothetical protein
MKQTLRKEEPKTVFILGAILVIESGNHLLIC